MVCIVVGNLNARISVYLDHFDALVSKSFACIPRDCSCFSRACFVVRSICAMIAVRCSWLECLQGPFNMYLKHTLYRYRNRNIPQVHLNLPNGNIASDIIGVVPSNAVRVQSYHILEKRVEKEAFDSG